jgi:hypothetical protein
MSTRSEKFRADEQRKGPKAAKPQVQRKRGATPAEKHMKKHAEKSATYAMEPVPEQGRPSRKSTRKSANRAKPDTNLNLREARQKRSPEQTYRKARAQRTRVRGSSQAE